MSDIPIREFLEATPESLAEKQKAVLLTGFKEKLNKFKEYVCSEKYDKALDMMSSIGANRSLDCDDLLPGGNNDAGDVIERLQRLTEIIKREAQS